MYKGTWKENRIARRNDLRHALGTTVRSFNFHNLALRLSPSDHSLGHRSLQKRRAVDLDIEQILFFFFFCLAFLRVSSSSLADSSSLLDATGVACGFSGLAALFVPGASLTCSTFSNGISSTSAEKSESFSESTLLDEEKLEDGVQSGDSRSSTPTGGETPNVIDLRKQQRKEPERPLYQETGEFEKYAEMQSNG
ncbi:hypothetical protein DKX38_026345 [Salix brachista]|uniref:Uncharacterized protein n=1 Tax=Salix brachista TaxID=2182728 RepID=A0A5N5JL24_9ROSI|nr:hypothetical protein DKX38_026345 [Salix brachista]